MKSIEEVVKNKKKKILGSKKKCSYIEWECSDGF